MKRLFIALLFSVIICCPHLATADDALAKIVIYGLNNAELKNAYSRLNTLLDSYNQQADVAKVNVLQTNGAQQIKMALQPFGYYKSIIRTKEKWQKSRHVIEFIVDKGPALLIFELSINFVGEGKNNSKLNDTLRSVPLKVGNILTTMDYEQAKSDLIAVANNQGYIKANFTEAAILVDLKNYRSTIILHLDTGKRYYFGKTVFQHTAYSDYFLQRFLNYREGEPFSNEKLTILEQDMSESVYFSEASIYPETENTKNEYVPVDIRLNLPRAQKYTLSLGYGTFTGPRLASGVSFRRVTDTGQHFDMNLQLASVLSIFSAKYYIPGSNPLTDNWMIGSDYRKFNPKNGESESVSLLFGYIKKIKRLRLSMTLNSLRERYEVLNMPNRNSHLFYPNFTANYVKSNDLLDPTFGYSANLILQGSSSQLFSTTSFMQADLKGKLLVSPFSFAKLIFRAEIASTAVHNLYELPLTMRFFAGGLNSIRGFADSSIGPGKYLQVGSIEYQNKIYDKLYGAVFYDIGAASNHVGTPINKGAGVGLVYYTLVGPIKIYLGRAISKKSQPYDIEFSLGPEF